MGDITSEFFAMADSMQIGEYVKDPSLQYDTILLYPELCTEELDFTQFVKDSYLKTVSEITGYIKEPHTLFIQPDEEKFGKEVALLTKFTINILNGAKVSILFQQEIVLEFLHKLVAVIIINNVENCNVHDKAISELLADPGCEAAFLALLAIIGLEMNYDALNKVLEHGDDLSFFSFHCNRFVNNYVLFLLTEMNIYGDDLFAFQSIIEEYNSEVFKAGTKNWLINPLAFVAETMYSLHEVNHSDQKHLNRAINSLRLDKQTFDLYHMLDQEITTQYGRLECDKTENLETEASQRMASLFMHINDHEMNVYAHELTFAETAFVLGECQRELALFVNELEDVVNDNINMFLQASVFGEYLSLHQEGLVGPDTVHSDNPFSLRCFKRSTTEETIGAPVYDVATCNYDIEEPPLFRLAKAVFFNAERSFMSRELCEHMCCCMKGWVSARLYRVERRETTTQVQKFVNEVFYEYFLEAVVTVEGRLAVAAGNFVREALKFAAEHFQSFNPLARLIIIQAIVDYGCVFRIQSQLVDLVGPQFEAAQQITVLLRFFHLNVRLLLRMLFHDSPSRLTQLGGKFIEFREAVLYNVLRLEATGGLLTASTIARDANYRQKNTLYAMVWRLATHEFPDLGLPNELEYGLCSYECPIKLTDADVDDLILAMSGAAQTTGNFQGYSKLYRTKFVETLQFWAALWRKATAEE